MPDRLSRTGHLAHDPDGMSVFVPDSDPPKPDAPVAPPPASPRASLPPGRAQSVAVVLAVVLGSGGASELIRALRGDGGQAQATTALTVQVQVLSATVARLEPKVESLAKLVVEMRAADKAREDQRRQQLTEVRSHLTQPPRPDVPGAIRVLDE